MTAVSSLMDCLLDLPSLENDTHAIGNVIVYTDHMKIANAPSSPS